MAGTLRFGVRLGAIVLVAAMTSACTGRYESDFPVIVVNRTANPIQALADGKAIGLVDPGQTQSFSLELPESNPNIFVNGTAPTPRADVTFTARDTRTGALKLPAVGRRALLLRGVSCEPCPGSAKGKLSGADHRR